MDSRKLKITGIIIAAAGAAGLIGCAVNHNSSNSDTGAPVAQVVEPASDKNSNAVTTATVSPEATATVAPTATPALNTLEFVATDSVNVREVAGTDADVIDSLEIGEKVTVLEEVDGPEGDKWYHITYDRDGSTIDGYASKLYINQVHKIDEADTDTSAGITTDINGNKAENIENTNTVATDRNTEVSNANTETNDASGSF